MIKYMCDICGKETNNKTYRFPYWKDVRGGVGNSIKLQKAEIGEADVYLCEEHRKIIADMVYYNK